MDKNSFQDPERRKKIAKVLIVIAALLLILGVLPLSISWRLGLVLAVFTLVLAGLIMVAIRNPDPPHEQYEPDKDDTEDGIPKAPE